MNVIRTTKFKFVSGIWPLALQCEWEMWAVQLLHQCKIIGLLLPSRYQRWSTAKAFAVDGNLKTKMSMANVTTHLVLTINDVGFKEVQTNCICQLSTFLACLRIGQKIIRCTIYALVVERKNDCNRRIFQMI